MNPHSASQFCEDDIIGLAIGPVHPTVAARIHGLDLKVPLTELQVQEVEQASGMYPVLIFPSQWITDDQLMAFSENFLALAPVVSHHSEIERSSPVAGGQDISNLDKDNKPLAVGDKRRVNFLGSRRWHTDGSYLPIRNRYSLLLSYTVAKRGGKTQFADMRAAYDALPQELRDIVEDLTVVHHVMYSRAVAGFTDYPPEEHAKFPPTEKKLVQRHPISGRKTLYLSGHAWYVKGRRYRRATIS